MTQDQDQDQRAVYRLTWTERGGERGQVDPLHRYSLTETIMYARRRALTAEHTVITRFPRDDTHESAGVRVWSDGRFLTPDRALLLNACTIAGDAFSAGSVQSIGLPTITDARTVSFRAVDWDGTSYVVTVRTEAQSNARTRSLLSPVGDAHAVIRECADCNDQSYVFASDALSDAHDAMHRSES